MRMKNTDALNSLNLSGTHIGNLPFSVCWISASNEKSVECLNFRNHHHAFFELHFVVKGSMGYGINGKLYTLEDGDLMIVPPGLVHRVVHCDENFVKLTVAFNLKDGGDGRLHTLNPSVRKTSEDIKRSIDSLFSSSLYKSSYRQALAELAVVEIVIRTIESFGIVCPTPKDDICDERVLKAKMLIEDNTDVFFTCDELAGYCRVSTKQLGRLFKKYEGVGLLEYIHTQKAEVAKRMLLELDLPQKRISELLGFSDSGYFGKFFLRVVGMTPSEYISKEKSSD